MSKQLSPEAVKVLRGSTIVPNPPEKRIELYFNRQMERKLYEEVIGALVTIEGKWSRSDKAIIFPEIIPVSKHVSDMINGQVAPEKNPNQYFGTPAAVADLMISMALPDLGDLDKSHTHVLEPSAGRGGILARLEEHSFNGWVTAVELNPYNHQVLEGLFDFTGKWRLFKADFLTWSDNEPHAQPEYNVVLMNPPFKTKGSPHVYVAHILLAFTRLSHNGRLVSVVPNGLFTNKHKHCASLREVIDRHGSVTPLEADSFKESGTRVNASLIELVKYVGRIPPRAVE